VWWTDTRHALFRVPTRYLSNHLTIAWRPPYGGTVTEGGGPSLDQVFHALADPTRRGIVATLVRGPASVSSLAGPLDMTLSAVLQHLQVLIDSGLVTSTKVGRVRTCAIDTGALRRAEEWLGGQRTTWERRLDRLDTLLGEEP